MEIGIQDPFTVTGNYIGILNTIDSSIVTSGDYERYFIHNGERYHHIIDAKTGYPAKNEISGISIISNKSIDGDALSTALFVMGIEEGTKLANSLEDINTILSQRKKKLLFLKN